MCKKQTSVSHSSAESEVISLDAGLRMDGISALDLWDLVIQVLRDQINVPASGNRWRKYKTDSPIPGLPVTTSRSSTSHTSRKSYDKKLSRREGDQMLDLDVYGIIWEYSCQRQ